MILLESKIVAVCLFCLLFVDVGGFIIQGRQKSALVRAEQFCKEPAAELSRLSPHEFTFYSRIPMQAVEEALRNTCAKCATVGFVSQQKIYEQFANF